MHGQTFAISGCPRSGTTWLHNALIAAGRFKGIRGDDAAPASRGLFVTDENQYVHSLLLRIAGGGVTERRAAQGCLTLVHGMLRARFGGREGLLLKSPYFSFFADLLFAEEFVQKVVYIKRDLISIALSMLRHPFLKEQINGNRSRFSSMIYKGTDFEVSHVPRDISRDFEERYSELTSMERAFYKCLCFETSMGTFRHMVPRDKTFIVDYGTLGTDGIVQTNISEFLELTAGQRALVFKDFNASRRFARAEGACELTEFMKRVLVARDVAWRQ